MKNWANIYVIKLMLVKYVHIRKLDNDRVGEKRFPHLIALKQYLVWHISVPLGFKAHLWLLMLQK
jgi:hypothetical protein